MVRTAIGGWIVTLVLVGAVVSSALSAPGVRGSALRAEPPAPPPAGTCVVDLTLPPVVVDCGQVHQGEVVEAWTSADTEPADTTVECASAVQEHLGLGVATRGLSWTVRHGPSLTTLVHGPGPEFLPGWSWSACVFAPVRAADFTPEPRTGSLRDVLDAPVGPRPEAWLSCRSDPEGAEVACTVPHRAEVVGMAYKDLSPVESQLLNTTVEGSITDPVVEEDCARYVQAYLGQPGGVHDDVLTATVTYQGLEASGTPLALFECAVSVVGDLDLTDTVNAIGTDPLPVG